MSDSTDDREPDELELFANSFPRFSQMVEKALEIARAKFEEVPTSHEPNLLYNEIEEILRDNNCGFRALDRDGKLSEDDSRTLIKAVVADRNKELSRLAGLIPDVPSYREIQITLGMRGFNQLRKPLILQ